MRVSILPLEEAGVPGGVQALRSKVYAPDLLIQSATHDCNQPEGAIA